MSIRRETPCDWGNCPYADPITGEVPMGCEAWCFEPEPQDYPEIWEDEVEAYKNEHEEPAVWENEHDVVEREDEEYE